MRTTQTRSVKPTEALNKWIVIDAEGVIVGRLASYVALRLRGKHRASFTPHIDTGDHIIIVNAEKVVLTGNKMTDKLYHRHTGYAGGIKTRVAGKVLASKHPERVLEKAVERMLPKESPLARKQYSKLHIYAGPTHKHEAQQPETVDFKSMNRKNARGA